MIKRSFTWGDHQGNRQKRQPSPHGKSCPWSKIGVGQYGSTPHMFFSQPLSENRSHEVVADARGFTSALAFLSPFTWAAGENYLAVIASMGGEEMVNYFAIPMMDGYKRVLESVGGGSLDYLTASYISCGVFGSLSLIFGYLGLRFSHRGRQV